MWITNEKQQEKPDFAERNSFLKACFISMPYFKILCCYRGGLFLVSIGHHADTSQVFFSASNLTHDPVWIPVGGKKHILNLNQLTS